VPEPAIQFIIVYSYCSFDFARLIPIRQVGKTTLLKVLISNIPEALYVDLEKPSDREMLSDP
jgi:predicted AAA+ superfamily ATPase